MDRTINKNLKILSSLQRRAAEKLIAKNQPIRRRPSTLKQWFVWLALSIIVVIGATGLVHPQPHLMDHLLSPQCGLFLSLVFFGSAFSAWGAIASSIPGEEPGLWQKILTVLLLGALFAMPFLFFPLDDPRAVIEHGNATGWFCFRTVVWVAFCPWIAIGWMVSKNASCQPAWTGAWLGVSAFLLGVGTVQIHCAHWESFHMILDHLMPMVLFLFLPVWIGTYWFSRWQK